MRLVADWLISPRISRDGWSVPLHVHAPLRAPDEMEMEEREALSLSDLSQSARSRNCAESKMPHSSTPCSNVDSDKFWATEAFDVNPDAINFLDG